MLRKTIALLALIFPLNAFAIGLGPISVKSYLNQPLDAKVALISTNNISLSAIQVELASNSEFDRAGLARPFYLTKLRFELSKSQSGRVNLLITTKDPVREPFLQFLVKVTSIEGSVLREYTILLDPQPVVNKQNEAPKTTKVAKLEAQQTPKLSDTDGHRIKVMQRDSLWKIARRYNTSGRSIKQLVHDIYAANPHAFVNGNSNQLKAGVSLTIPGVQQTQITKRPQIKQKQKRVEKLAPIDSVWSLAQSTKQPGRLRLREPVIVASQTAETVPQQLQVLSDVTTTNTEETVSTSPKVAEQLAVADEQIATLKRQNKQLEERLTTISQQYEKTHKFMTQIQETMTQLQINALEQKQQSNSSFILKLMIGLLLFMIITVVWLVMRVKNLQNKSLRSLAGASHDFVMPVNVASPVKTQEDLEMPEDVTNATKLNLARSYIEMNDKKSAKKILEQILLEGDFEQQQQASRMMSEL